MNIYIVLRHDHEPDELTIMQAWTKREPAQAAAERLLKDSWLSSDSH